MTSGCLPESPVVVPVAAAAGDTLRVWVDRASTASRGDRAAPWSAGGDVWPSRGHSLSCVADGGGWAWRAGAGIGRKARGLSRHVNIECSLGTVVIGEPKGLNQARQDVKQGDPVIALHVQGVERTVATAASYRRRTGVVSVAPVVAVGAPDLAIAGALDSGGKPLRASAGRARAYLPSRDFQAKAACLALAAFTHNFMHACPHWPPSFPPGPPQPRSEPGSSPCRPYRPRGTALALHPPEGRPGRDAWLQVFATLRAPPCS